MYEIGGVNVLLLIIDGTSLSVRSFFAAREDEDTGLALFSYWMRLLLNQFNPTHTAVAWDTKGGSSKRKQLLPEYKANRPKSVNTSNYNQKCLEVSQDIGFKNLILPEYEADDIIGKVSEFDIPTVIITGDKDMLQLIDDNTTVYTPINGVSNMKVWDRHAVKDKYDVYPEQFVDYKALVGDSSDNYHGVKGIGPKTASKLLNQYQNITGIYQNLEQLNPHVRAKLEAGRDSCRLSRQLAKLHTDDIDDISLSELEC